MDAHQEIDDKSPASMPTDDSMNMLQIELTNKTGTYRQYMNEDCLLKIFSIKSLTLMDFCSLAETCARFKQIASRIFPKELGIDRDRKMWICKSKNYWEAYDTAQNVERILKNFGPYLSKLSLCEDVAVVNPVAKYCGAATLRSLRSLAMDTLEISEGFILKLKLIFQRLLNLSLVSCDLTKVVTGPYINCDSLIELKVRNSSGCAAILKNTFPNLEKFRFDGCQIFSENNNNCSDILLKFIERHKRLRSLYLSAHSVYCSSEVLRTIDNSCKELTELTLRNWNIRKTSLYFSNLLPKLKMLDVDFNFENYGQLIGLLKELPSSLETVKLFSQDYISPVRIFNVLSQLKNLRELHLFYDSFDDNIPWAMLTQLKKLYLGPHDWDGFFVSDVSSVVRQLINLEELEFDRGQVFPLSNEDVSEIVKIVEQRAHVLTLKCGLNEDILKNRDKNGKVRLINWNE